MLVLARKVGEGIRIGGDVVITVDEVRGRQVRLRIHAPPAVPVHREEIYQAVIRANRDAVIPRAMTRSVVALFESGQPAGSNARGEEEKDGRQDHAVRRA